AAAGAWASPRAGTLHGRIVSDSLAGSQPVGAEVSIPALGRVRERMPPASTVSTPYPMADIW
ncbi:MAG TPA: hypothetical protein VHV78_13820, partial [Gemmatimonadaceae bacterium]|nr:hypothetical protein [Gemmatimonadaceae bacterium]